MIVLVLQIALFILEMGSIKCSLRFFRKHTFKSVDFSIGFKNANGLDQARTIVDVEPDSPS